MIDKYYNSDLLESHGMYTKLLYNDDEREEFNKICDEASLERNEKIILKEPDNLDYLGVFDKQHNIVGGCKLANSKALKYSFSQKRHKFPLELLANKYNQPDLLLSNFTKENEVYSEIYKIFSLIDNATIINVLSNSLFVLFAEQGVDYAIEFIDEDTFNLIASSFGDVAKINKLKEISFTFEKVSSKYFLIRIDHESNEFIKKHKEAIREAGFGVPSWVNNKK